MRSETSLRVPDPGIRDLFTEASHMQAWLDVEVALAWAEADLGMIPREAAEEIARRAVYAELDAERIEEGLQRTGHPLVPLVWELARNCEGDAGNYVHWGATTQNICDTGDLLLVRRANRIFLGLLARTLNAMAALAERSKDMALPARTHGQHAVPATFGYKVAVWIDELSRHTHRLREAEPRVFVAALGGAAGTFASFGPRGFEVQAGTAAYLGMTPMSLPSRTIQDHYGEYACLLALLAATCHKIGNEVFTLMKQEFGEVREPVPPGTVGSSTMPQKRNPILSQDIVACAAEVRALLPLALEAMQVEHEANRATSTMMRRAIEGMCEQTGDMLARLLLIIEGITLDPARMRANLDLTGGLILSEAVMLSLGEHLGRQHAHDVVYDAVEAAMASGRPFAELLAEDAQVRAHLDAGQITALLDPERYTGLCSQIASEQAAKGRETAIEIDEWLRSR